MSGALALVNDEEREINLPDWVWEALQDETQERRFWITKGLGSGGTYGACMWHYAMCEKNYRSKYSWAVAPTLQQIKDTLIPTFFEVLTNEYGLEEGVDFEINVSQNPELKLIRSGQVVTFRSAHRPERMVGPSISHITGTEPGLWPTLAFQKAASRLRCPRAMQRQEMYEGTPEGLGNYYEQEANFDEGVNEDRNSVRIILETEDNEHLPASYAKNLDRIYEHDPQKLISYKKGLFTGFTRGTAYWEFFESRNVKLDLIPSPKQPLIFSWDFGNPVAWVALQEQLGQRNGEFVRRYPAMAEGSGTAKGYMDACAEFVAWVSQLPGDYSSTPIHLDGGHDGYTGHHLSDGCAYEMITQYLKRYFRNVQTHAMESAPLIKDRLERANALFALERAMVAAWCTNLRKSLTHSNTKEGTWKLEKKAGKDFTHHADAYTNALYRLTRHEDIERPTARKRYGLNR